MATVTAGAPADFSIGRVMSRAFGAVGKNLVTFLALSLLSVSPLLLMIAAAPAALIAGGPAVTNQLFNSPVAIAALAGALILYVVFYFMLQAALVHGTVAYLNGRKASFSSCFATGLRVFFPMIGIAFLVGWGVILGFVLLIVPGIMLAMRWIVSVPVRVAEGPGILNAMGRSAELTRGHRWPILGLVAIFFVAQLMLRGAAAPFSSGIAVSGGGGTPLMTLAVGEGLDWIVGAVIAMFTAVGVASIYYELRSIKEGIGPEQLAAVFA